jgi:predicted nucleic acid-binding protein
MDLQENATLRAAARFFEQHKAAIQAFAELAERQRAEIIKSQSAMQDALTAIQRQQVEQAKVMAEAIASAQRSMAQTVRTFSQILHEVAHSQLQKYMADVVVKVEGGARDRALARLAVHSRYRRPRVEYRTSCRLRRNEGTHIPTYAVFWDGARSPISPNQTLARREREHRRYSGSGAH